MIIKIKDKEYSFDGYVNPISSVHKLAEDIYQQGRADAIEECIKAIEESKSLFDNHHHSTWKKLIDIKQISQLKEICEIHS